MEPSNPRFVKVEYPIKIGTREILADYVLFRGSNPFCVIEVKSPTTLINAEHIQQACSYAKLLNCEIFILSNASEWKFGLVEENDTILNLDLEHLSNNIELLSALSYDSKSEDVSKLIKQMHIREYVTRVLDESEDELVELIVGWIIEKNEIASIDEISMQIVREAIINFMSQETPTPIEQDPQGGQLSSSTFRHTTRRDWEPVPGELKGVYRYKSDHSIIIDVRKSGREVRNLLRKFGLDSTPQTAFGGFYYTLRQDAGIVTRRS